MVPKLTVVKNGHKYVVNGSTFALNKYELQDMLKKLQQEAKDLPVRISNIKEVLQYIKEEERGANERVHNLAYAVYEETSADYMLSREDFDQHYDYKGYIDQAKAALRHLGVK